MTYEKLNLADGQVLTADHLKHIEEGIASAGSALGGLKGKKISFLGDSITTFNGYNPAGYAVWYPNDTAGITDVDKTWWMQLIKATGMVLLKNAAWSGSLVTGASNGADASAGCSNKRIADLAGDDGTHPDIIVVLIGINDFANGRSVGNWDGTYIPSDGTISGVSEAYALMAYKIANAYPNAEVFMCTLLECQVSSYDGGFDSRTIIDWNDAIRFVAESFGFNVIDMHACGINYYNARSLTAEGLHPNAKGARMMAKKAVVEIGSKSIHCGLLADEI